MKLKDCPFCGSTMEWDDILETKLGIAGWCGLFAVVCLKCLSRTAEYDTKNEAAEAWNKRVKEL